MENFRAVDGLFGAGILGAFIVGAVALSHLVNIDKAVNGDKPLTAASSPIHVRGGSMTAFTRGKGDAKSGWAPTGASGQWCTTLERSASSLDVYGEDLDGTTYGLLASDPWVVTIYAHKPNDFTYGPSSTEGMQLISKQTDCSGRDKNKNSVTLTFFGNSESYADLPDTSRHSGNKRFHDKVEACLSDQDLCERMAAVNICLPNAGLCPPGGSPPSPASSTYRCTDGDCTIKLEK